MKAKILDIFAMLAFGVLIGYLVAEFLTGMDPFYKQGAAMQKLTFNRAGWIVCCIEVNNWFNYTRFDTKAAARAYLKANPAAWFCG